MKIDMVVDTTIELYGCSEDEYWDKKSRLDRILEKLKFEKTTLTVWVESKVNRCCGMRTINRGEIIKIFSSDSAKAKQIRDEIMENIRFLTSCQVIPFS